MYSYSQDLAYRIVALTAAPMGQDMASAVLRQIEEFKLDKPQAEACSKIVEILYDLWDKEGGEE